VVGDAEAQLIPGTGSPSTDCILEWDVIDPREEPPATRRGLLTPKRTCVDGDVLCDADGMVDGACRFALRGCLNVTDRRLQDRHGQPACVASDVQTVLLKRPRPTDPKPERAAAGMVVRDLFANLAPSSVSGSSGERVTFDPPVATPDGCTAFGTVVVPLNGAARSTLKLVLRAETSPAAGHANGLRDADKLELRCVRAD
jgi:hypothetical protein